MTQNKNQNIIYFDTNNLYGSAMSKFLPIWGFKWIDTSNNSKDLFSKLILNILKSYENYTTIIF